MNILKLIAQLGLDGRGFKAGMREASSFANKTSRDMESSFKRTVAGTFGAAAITTAVKKTIDYGGSIADAAKKAQTHVEALQEEKYWLEQNGGSLDDLVNAYKFLARAKDAALGGDQEKLDVFNTLGVDKATLAGQTLSQTFRTIAETMRKTDFGDAGLPMLEKVLGKVAQQLLPAFSESLGDAAAEAQKLGIVLKDEVISELDATGDEIDKLIARVRGPLAQAFSFFAKHARQIYDFLDMTVGGAGAYFQGYVEKTKELADGNVMRLLFDSFGPGDSEKAHEFAAKMRKEHQDEVIARRLEADNPKPVTERTKGSVPIGDSADTSRALKDREGLQARLQEATLRVEMAKVKTDEAKQRKALEKQLFDAESEASKHRTTAADARRNGSLKPSEIESMENDAIRAQIKSMGIREQLTGLAPDKEKPSSLDVSSLTSQGTLASGRNVIATDSDKTEAAVKDVGRKIERVSKSVDAIAEKARRIDTIIGAA